MLNLSAPAGAALPRLLLALWAASAILISCTNAIGVNFGQVGNNLPTNAFTLQLVQGTTIKKLKIYDANPGVLTTFAGTGIAIVIAADNDQVQPLAQTTGYALQWAQANIAAYPNTSIVGVALGNEVLSYQLQLIPFLLPALQNLQAALVTLGLDKTVYISSPNSLGIISKSFPPSYGEFHYYNGNIMSPLLDFYAQTGYPFMINVYPYFAYASAPDTISLDYVLFSANATPVYDDGSGLNYTNMFDAQVDAVYAAIAKLGYTNITLAVTETGWPSAGDPNEAGASVQNAQLFNANLVQHIESGVGTPARPGVTVDTYIFALYNENMKPGPTSERNFGLYNPDGTPVYNSGLNVSPQWYSPPPPAVLPPVGSWPPPPVVVLPPVASWPPPPVVVLPPVASWPPPPVVVLPPVADWPPPPLPALPPAAGWSPPPPFSGTQPPPLPLPPPTAWSPPPPPVALAPMGAPPDPTTPSPGVPVAPGPGVISWCVARPDADPGQLQIALDWACSTGGADCTVLQTGGTCFLPNTLVSHASYAFDSYYTLNKRNAWDCFFSDTAVVTTVNPSSAGCPFP